jgi:divalent metal cation (Fe/Co/Zn/Cd) transporter
VHKTLGLRDPATAFPLPRVRDPAADRRAANRAVAVSAIGLGATGLIELVLAVLTGSVGLLGDAIHNLSDVSTSARARWTGRTLRVEIEGWVDPALPARDADAIGSHVAATVARQLPQTGSFTWTSRADPD